MSLFLQLVRVQRVMPPVPGKETARQSRTAASSSIWKPGSISVQMAPRDTTVGRRPHPRRRIKVLDTELALLTLAPVAKRCLPVRRSRALLDIPFLTRL